MKWIKVDKNSPAPKDGKEYLAYENGRIFVFSYSYGDFVESCLGEWPHTIKPTHWMELPEKPNDLD